MGNNRQILHIIPAQDWYAVFNNMATGEQYYTPLVCWALLAEDGGQAITGMVTVEKKVVACTEDADFSHYLYQTELEIATQNEEPP
jgi:hypothetical protein